MDEATLIEKLLKIEALFVGACHLGTVIVGDVAFSRLAGFTGLALSLQADLS